MTPVITTENLEFSYGDTPVLRLSLDHKSRRQPPYV